MTQTTVEQGVQKMMLPKKKTAADWVILSGMLVNAVVIVLILYFYVL